MSVLFGIVQSFWILLLNAIRLCSNSRSKQPLMKCVHHKQCATQHYHLLQIIILVFSFFIIFSFQYLWRIWIFCVPHHRVDGSRMSEFMLFDNFGCFLNFDKRNEKNVLFVFFFVYGTNRKREKIDGSIV